MNRNPLFDFSASSGLSDRRGGFALPAAVFALVVVGIMVTGGFFLAQQESRISVASEYSSLALRLAEQGINEVRLDWDGESFYRMANWDSETFNGTEDQGTWTVEVLKTDDTNFFISSTGTVTEGGAILSGATRDVGMLTRILIPDIEPPAAISTVGSMTVAGSSQIQGNDTDPTGWGTSCTGMSTGQDKPGILIDDADNVSRNGNAYSIDGNPEVQGDPSLTSEGLLDFGETDWDWLVSMADKVYSSSVSITNTAPDSVATGGEFACRTSTQSNWGDPLNPGAACGSYFPIIYAAQDMSIQSGAAGQGILLVEGDLSLQGGYEFYGIVIVRGTFSTAGTGGHVNGGVIAANASLDTSTVTGNAVVTNSTCAAQRAILNSAALARPVAINDRSWVDLSGTSY